MDPEDAVYSTGMSRLEVFAAAIAQGWFASQPPGWAPYPPEDVAKLAFDYAEAMEKEAEERRHPLIAVPPPMDYVEEMENWKCRHCGCTSEDCRQCVEAQGEACYWVEKNLCSRCALSVRKGGGS